MLRPLLLTLAAGAVLCAQATWPGETRWNAERWRLPGNESMDLLGLQVHRTWSSGAYAGFGGWGSLRGERGGFITLGLSGGWRWPLTERLGLDAGRPQLVWDFWNGRYLGVHSGAVDVSVAPYSVRLLRIARARAHPWVISTDMHVRQGQAEIADVRWDPARQELTVKATRPAGYRGSVFVHVPKGLALKEPAGLWIAKDANDSSLIVRCAFQFKDGTPVEKTLRFKTIP